MELLSEERIVEMLVGQCRYAELWIGLWEKNKNPMTLRHAAMAIGKINGIYSVLINTTSGFANLPPEVTELMNKYREIWDNLFIPERT